MSAIRTFLQRRAGLVALLLAFALAARALVPAGYMASSSPNGLTIELCSGVAGKTVTLMLPGAPAHQQEGKADMGSPCAFSGGGVALTSAIDPFLLAGAIAFAIMLGFRPARTLPAEASAYLRPPLRGPPHA